MDFFKNMFGKNEAQKAPTAADAIQGLRNTEEMLIKKQGFLEQKINNELKLIKENGMKNKRVSLQALKRKKRLEAELSKLDGQLTTIEYQRESLENANTNTEVLKVMQSAGKAMQSIHKEINIDKVEDIMDEVREQQQIAEEISQVISNPALFGQDVDEDDLMKELEEMEQEEIEKNLLDTTPISDLPEVPTSELREPAQPAAAVQKKKVAEDSELDELRQWAN